MSTKAILLINLGSPDSYQVKDVKRYLREFLMDKRVIDVPYLLRWFLVNVIIVPFRAKKSAEKYQTIWTDKGSPLIVISKELQKKVAEATKLPVALAMRYANPTPQEALENLAKTYPDLNEVIVFPLYPHYAMSSYETAIEHVKKAYQQKNYPFQLKIIPPYYHHSSYINALSNSIAPFLKDNFDHILFSYHGVPNRHITKTDPTKKHCFKTNNCCNTNSIAHNTCYRHQVITTTKAVAEKLNLKSHEYSFSFQSRLGKSQWLEPYTTVKVTELAKNGVKNLLVVCPAFVSDCLETLEEIAIEVRQNFLDAGGQTFTLIPCLNTNEDWIQAIKVICKI